MKAILLQREASLITTLDHLDEQYKWATDSGYFDLRDAYTAAQSLILDRLSQVQKMIAQCPDNKDMCDTLTLVKEDIQKLKDGVWFPDEDSCDATLDNIEAVLTRLGGN